METLRQFLPIFSAIAALWEVGNGILHDIFVIKEHKGLYDRNLLRLLMDGHILITCGIMHFISWQLILINDRWGYWLCVAASVSMLVYVGMIWPFLKSVLTMAINAGLLLLALLSYFIQ